MSLSTSLEPQIRLESEERSSWVRMGKGMVRAVEKGEVRLDPHAHLARTVGSPTRVTGWEKICVSGSAIS